MNVAEGPPTASRQQETIVFLLLTVVLFPVLSVAVVGGYGFMVWMYQIFAGPPTG